MVSPDWLLRALPLVLHGAPPPLWASARWRQARLLQLPSSACWVCALVLMRVALGRVLQRHPVLPAAGQRLLHGMRLLPLQQVQAQLGQ